MCKIVCFKKGDRTGKQSRTKNATRASTSHFDVFSVLDEPGLADMGGLTRNLCAVIVCGLGMTRKIVFIRVK